MSDIVVRRSSPNRTWALLGINKSIHEFEREIMKKNVCQPIRKTFDCPVKFNIVGLYGSSRHEFIRIEDYSHHISIFLVLAYPSNSLSRRPRGLCFFYQFFESLPKLLIFFFR